MDSWERESKAEIDTCTTIDISIDSLLIYTSSLISTLFSPPFSGVVAIAIAVGACVV